MIYLYTTTQAKSVHDFAGPILRGHEYEIVKLQTQFPLPLPGDVLVCLGLDAFKQLQTFGYLAKNRSLSSMRGKAMVLAPDTGHVICSFSPGVQYSDTQQAFDLACDLRLATRVVTTGRAEPALGLYRYVSLREFEERVRWLTEKRPVGPVTLDLETEGFYPWYDHKEIITLQISWEEGSAEVLYLPEEVPRGTPLWDRFVKAVQALLTSPRVRLRGAHLKFDLLWLRVKTGVVCTNFSFDTLLAGSLLNENRSNSLSAHSKEFTDLGGYDADLEENWDKGKMREIPKEVLLPYAGGDTDAAMRVSNQIISGLCRDQRLENFYARLLHPASRAFENIEYRGIVVDLDRYHDAEVEAAAEIKSAHDAAISMIPARLRAKFADNLSLSRPSLIVDFMFSPMGLGLKPLKTTTTGKVASDAAHLKMFQDHPEAGVFLEALSRWKVATKIQGTYIHGFLEHLRPDGRFHPTYMLFAGDMFENSDETGGTNTGRTSAKGPAIQTQPKHVKKGHKPWAKILRRAFTAPPGYVVFEADYSQGELRVTADVADEKVMLNAYRTGKDLHCLTGSGFAKMGYDDFIQAYKRADAGDPTLDKVIAQIVETFRQRAKSANFGLLYGMSAGGYQIYARDVYDVKMSAKEAEDAHAGFFKTYPGLVDWHKEYGDRLSVKDGFVRSPLGRVRHLPLRRSPDRKVASQARRQAINAPIQSTLSDMALLAIALMEQELAPKGLWLAGMTHDSIFGYIPEAEVHWMLPRMREIMENLPLTDFGWDPKLSFPADFKVGPNWADLKKAA